MSSVARAAKRQRGSTTPQPLSLGLRVQAPAKVPELLPGSAPTVARSATSRQTRSELLSRKGDLCPIPSYSYHTNSPLFRLCPLLNGQKKQSDTFRDATVASPIVPLVGTPLPMSTSTPMPGAGSPQ